MKNKGSRGARRPNFPDNIGTIQGQVLSDEKFFIFGGEDGI